ncbi:hypothetical protein EJ02DRAFT_456318 [Clathrospora elynae]|uniref:Secreted protein n=1 Tax=Clathrospora elynae TaxID=706981 RepID=A0A6A5SJ39_9PLEO|nr:hypothetical protein EJ02DRAFT_456318 [Clathrospora elynae]
MRCQRLKHTVTQLSFLLASFLCLMLDGSDPTTAFANYIYIRIHLINMQRERKVLLDKYSLSSRHRMYTRDWRPFRWLLPLSASNELEEIVVTILIYLL